MRTHRESSEWALEATTERVAQEESPPPRIVPSAVLLTPSQGEEWAALTIDEGGTPQKSGVSHMPAHCDSVFLLFRDASIQVLRDMMVFPQPAAEARPSLYH